ncbi:alcohol dehydrogenase catalytic domain-containing protein [Streptomyces sp. L7]
MATMKSLRTGGVDKVEVVDVERPVPGPSDALIRIRACGICGTDVSFLHMGGMPARAHLGGDIVPVPLGHEPAGEVIEIGAEVEGLAVGDRVVIDPTGHPTGLIGCGGTQGAMSEYVLVENAAIGQNVAVFPHHLPFSVAALNEPMAVARHAVNRPKRHPATRWSSSAPGPSAWARRSG